MFTVTIFRRSARAFILAVGFGIPASVSNADAVCAEFSPLIADAKANFDDADLPSLRGADTCKLTRSLSGSRAYHCSWGYPYRSEIAERRFKEMADALHVCFGETVGAGNDKPVNHPDTYDQLQYRSGHVAILVSLKDKAALERTFISIGIIGVADK